MKRNHLSVDTEDFVEYAPMLNTPHALSGSEMSLSNHPPFNSPPGTGVMPTIPYHDSPGSQRPPPDTPPQDPTRLSPGSTPEARQTPSPKPSYYSVSDLPLPSPVPETIYRYTTGEIAPTPPSPRHSISSRRTRASIEGQQTLRSSSPPPVPPPTVLATLQPSNAEGGNGISDADEYEMQVRARSPFGRMALGPSDRLQPTRASSNMSFVTAQDRWSDEGIIEDIDAQTVRADDDAATVTPDHDSRRESRFSWTVGRAL